MNASAVEAAESSLGLSNNPNNSEFCTKRCFSLSLSVIMPIIVVQESLHLMRAPSVIHKTLLFTSGAALLEASHHPLWAALGQSRRPVQVAAPERRGGLRGLIQGRFFLLLVCVLRRGPELIWEQRRLRPDLLSQSINASRLWKPVINSSQVTQATPPGSVVTATRPTNRRDVSGVGCLARWGGLLPGKVWSAGKKSQRLTRNISRTRRVSAVNSS